MHPNVDQPVRFFFYPTFEQTKSNKIQLRSQAVTPVDISVAKIKVPAGPQIFDARTNGQDTDEAEEIESTHAALRACSVKFSSDLLVDGGLSF